RTIAGPQNASTFKDVNHSGGARVPEAQSSLKHRCRSALFLANNLEAFFHKHLIFFTHFLLGGSRSIQLALDRRIKGRRTLRGNELDQTMNLLVGNKDALRPYEPGGPGG